MEFEVGQGGWRRKSLLLALAGVHLVALVLWRPVVRQPEASAQRITWLQLLPDSRSKVATTPAPRPQPARTSPQAAVAQSMPPQATPAQHTSAASPVAAPNAQTGPQPITLPRPEAQSDYFATTPPARESALDAAKRNAGAVDRQLRKEVWNPHDKFVANNQTALAGRLAAAFQGDEGVRYEDVTLPDGRHMTKVHAGGVTYCAVTQSNTLVGGRDVFRDGVKTAISTCPR